VTLLIQLIENKKSLFSRKKGHFLLITYIPVQLYCEVNVRLGNGGVNSGECAKEVLSKLGCTDGCGELIRIQVLKMSVDT
jgi:hypothetical protein